MAKTKTEMPTFRRRLRELIGDRTYEEFGNACGITRQTVSYYLSGKRSPEASVLIDIAVANDVSVDWLLGLSEVETQNPTVREVSQLLGLSEETVVRIILWREKMPKITKHLIDILSASFGTANLIRTLLDIYTLSWHQGVQPAYSPDEYADFNAKDLADHNPFSTYQLREKLSLHDQLCSCAHKSLDELLADVDDVASRETALATCASVADFDCDKFLSGGYDCYCDILDVYRYLHREPISSAEKARFEMYFVDNDVSAEDKEIIEDMCHLSDTTYDDSQRREFLESIGETDDGITTS